MTSPAVFFDRDGTIIKEVGFLESPRRLRLIRGAAEALRLAGTAGYLRVLVSNQSGIARGLFTEEAVKAVHRELSRRLAASGAGLDGMYFCPHHPEGVKREYRVLCDCRKPSPGMILRAQKELGIDISRSVVIGDKQIDVDLARRAGCRAVLVMTGYGRKERKEMDGQGRARPDHVAESVLAAVRWVIAHGV